MVISTILFMVKELKMILYIHRDRYRPYNLIVGYYLYI